MATAPDKRAVADAGDDDTEKLPSRLSPSRSAEYQQCPARFYFKSILRLPTAATAAQVRGTLAHEAFERIFDHPRSERVPDLAVSYVVPAWETLSAEGGYEHLDAAEVVADAEAMVRAWFGVEDPTRFDPADRELRLSAELAGVEVLGILDRVDKVQRADGSVVWVISDYKTGKVPRPDDRYLDEKFWGMKVYAALLHAATGEIPAALRLVFVGGGTPDSVRTISCDERLVAETTKKLRSVWRSIQRDAKSGRWPCRTGPLCQWCDFMQICPAWNPQLAGAELDGS
jgi:putative RecB family exonuclease